VQTQTNDVAARRAYWTEQMDAAYNFMMAILEYPVEECGERLVYLPDVAQAEGVKVEFSSTKIARDFDRIFYLRAGLIEDFVAIARDMNARGWILKVEDGFRSREMQKYLALKESIFDGILQKVIWEVEGGIPAPDLLFRRISALVATIPKIGTHMSGSAIDISVLRADDFSEVERGGPYIELSELTPMASPFVSAQAAQNRAEITKLMERHGFLAYPYEFWHYNKGDAYHEYLTQSGHPARYGAIDFDVTSGIITPVTNPKEPLHSLAEIQRYIEQALDRLH